MCYFCLLFFREKYGPSKPLKERNYYVLNLVYLLIGGLQ
jgi:hypothetical protein